MKRSDDSVHAERIIKNDNTKINIIVKIIMNTENKSSMDFCGKAFDFQIYSQKIMKKYNFLKKSFRKAVERMCFLLK